MLLDEYLGLKIAGFFFLAAEVLATIDLEVFGARSTQPDPRYMLFAVLVKNPTPRLKSWRHPVRLSNE